MYRKRTRYIKDVLKNNGFPDKQILLNATKPKSKIDNNNTDVVNSVCLSYIDPAELRESSASTTSKSITARTRKSIKSCFPTKTRKSELEARCLSYPM